MIWFDYLMYFALAGVIFSSGGFLIYWLLVEAPVLLKIKKEQLYNKWRD